MSDWFWKKLNYFSGWAAIAVLFILIILTANFELKDLDLWLHLATGRHILHTFQIPAVDVLSSTIAGQPWINHEWLFQVIVQSLFAWGQADALIALRVLIIIMIFTHLFLMGYKKDKQLLPIVGLLFVLLVYQLRFFLRPDIFSLFFFVLYVSILAFQLERKKSLWLLFFIQVLWSNIHGYFLLGPVIILIALFAEWLKRKAPLPSAWKDVGRLTDQEYKRLKQIFFLVLLACLFNPYGIKGVLYPLGVLFSLSGELKVFFEHIGELQHPLTWGNLWGFQVYPYYKIFILSSLFSFWANRRKIDIGILLLWIIFLFFSLGAVRNVGFFAVVAYLAVLSNLQNLSLNEIFPVRLKTKTKYFCSIAVKVFMIFWMVQHIEQIALRGYFDFDRGVRKSEFGGISLRNFPYKAVNFLVDNKVEGNFFNDFNSGAYLLGRAHPNIKVFIDGRTEVYGAEFFMNYRKIWKGDEALFKEAANRYQLTGAFLNSVYVPAPAKIIQHLYDNPQWALVYFDYDATIFLKDVEQNKEMIGRYRVDLQKWKPPRYNLLKLGMRNVTPYRHVNRAQALFNLKLFEKAQEEVQEAIRIAPHYAKAHAILGDIYIERKDYSQAFGILRKASLLDPQNLKTRYQVALVLYHLGDWSEAEAQCQRVLMRKQKNAKGLFLLSRIYAKQQRYDESWDIMQRAFVIAPDRVDDIVDVADIFAAREKWSLARKAYNLAFEADRDNEDIKDKIENLP